MDPSAPESILEDNLLPFAPLLARFAGTRNFTDDRARGFRAVFGVLIARHGQPVPTRDLIDALREARRPGLRNASKELKLQLGYLRNNLAELELKGYEFNLTLSDRAACLTVTSSKVDESRFTPSQLWIRKASTEGSGGRKQPMKGLTERNVVDWSARGTLEVSCRIRPPQILEVLNTTVAQLDERIRRYIRRHSVADVGYNTLVMGAASLAGAPGGAGGGRVNVCLEPMFRSWQLFAEAAENWKVVRSALKVGKLSALQPLHLALLVRLKHRGEEGFAVLRSNSSLADPGPWTVTCSTPLELFTIDDVEDVAFDLNRCAALMLHAHIGLRCRAAHDIRWYAAMNVLRPASNVALANTPTLLGVVTNRSLNLGTSEPVTPLAFETFQYIFAGRRDRQRLPQHGWPGEFWPDEKARQIAHDPDSPIDEMLRLVLTLHTLRRNESLDFGNLSNR